MREKIYLNIEDMLFSNNKSVASHTHTTKRQPDTLSPYFNTKTDDEFQIKNMARTLSGPFYAL